MKKLYVAIEDSEAELLKGLLERQGIECAIRDEESLNPVGPLVSPNPELWIMRDEDFDAAGQIIKDWRATSPVEAKDWTCPECHEVISGQFDTCWRCAGKEPVAESFSDNEEA